MTHTIKLADLCNLIAQGNQPKRITYRDSIYEYRDGRYENDYYGVFVLAFGKEYLDESITYTDTILTNKEREYLSTVLKPWKGERIYVHKYNAVTDEYNYLFLQVGDGTMSLPKFKADKYYTKLEMKIGYTPEDLELWTE